MINTVQSRVYCTIVITKQPFAYIAQLHKLLAYIIQQYISTTVCIYIAMIFAVQYTVQS